MNVDKCVKYPDDHDDDHHQGEVIQKHNAQAAAFASKE
jgi:hypothetical protein